jgi:hypothetical protein
VRLRDWPVVIASLLALAIAAFIARRRATR